MIDFIKLNITYLSESHLMAIQDIQWKGVFDPITGEVKEYPINGTYHCMRCKINPTRKEVSGSLHKLYNILCTGEDQNYNDFNYGHLTNIIQHLQDKFGIQPNETKIENLEYGVNVAISMSPTKLLTEHIVTLDGELPSKNNVFGGKGKFLQWDKSQVFQKCYDKGAHYNLSQIHIWRWERKVIKSAYLKKFGISHLSDLLDKKKLMALRGNLLDHFDLLIVVDQIDPIVNLTEVENVVWSRGVNPFYWSQLKNKHRSQKSRFAKTFNQLLHDLGLDTLKSELRSGIENKWNELLQCNDFTDFQHLQNATILPVYIESDCNSINHRYCAVTGIDITHQSVSSKFLWENSILTLYHSNPVIFEELCSQYLKSERAYANMEEMAYYISHNIRNTYWNNQYRMEKAKTKYAYSLFPLEYSVNDFDDKLNDTSNYA